LNIVDARNLSCPEPVVRTQNALEEITEGSLVVLVNSPEACQNVQSFAQSQGCGVKVNEKEGTFTIEIDNIRKADQRCRSGFGVLLFASDRLGSGDEDLGRLLITMFIDTLAEAAPRHYRMIFINSGVLLTTEGSSVLDTLQQLENAGMQISSCGTCLSHYHLKDKLKVGTITNMYDIATSLLTSEKVVRI
jgi:selenium metabolism protein YedF